jgi:YjbE family integral membrane protein
MDLSEQLIALLQVIAIDVVLAGDNAIIVGLAASRVAPAIRPRVIFWGIAAAVMMRIGFAAVTMQLLAIIGLTLAGGILLLWVCWKMFRELRIQHAGTALAGHGHAGADGADELPPLSFWGAVGYIAAADVSMSLDNVLAVAGAAKGNTTILVIGLAVAVLLMAVAASYLADLLVKHRWVSWVGLAIILYVAAEMIWRGGQEVLAASASIEGFPTLKFLAALFR